MTIEKLFLLALTALFTACAHGTTRAGDIRVLEIDPNKNPDVIWITRPLEVTTDDASAAPSVMYGLFACYRAASPMSPKCFLAKTYGDNDDIVWPGDPKDYNLK